MSHLPNRRYLAAMLGLALLLIISGTFLLLRANGYKLLTHPIRLVKTGVISLNIHPESNLTIRLNGVVQAKNVHDFPDLPPGRYTITIERDNMTTWEETINLKAGEAVRFPKIILFYTQPKSQPVDSFIQLSMRHMLDGVDWQDLSAGLKVIGGEIWADQELVARFSQTVRQAIWLERKTHLLALVGSDIHVMEADGGHDQILTTIPSQTAQVRFLPLAFGAELLIEIDGQLTILRITESYKFIGPNL